MKWQPKPSSRKVMLLLSLIVFLDSCKKDHREQPVAQVVEKTRSASTQKELSNARHDSAEVVPDWYRFVAQMQLWMSSQPDCKTIHQNFSYIGVELNKAVRPGIKHAASLSTVFCQMPQMPQIKSGKGVYAGLHYQFTQYVSLAMRRELGNFIARLDLKNPNSK